MIVVWAIVVLAGLLVGLAVALIVAERLLIHYGPCTIEINAGERTLNVQGGQTLLETLDAEDVFLPATCGGQGTCGRCKVVVASGGGAVLATETPMLTRAEIRQGVRLACQVKVRGDIQLRLAQELLDVREFAAEVTGERSLTGDIKEIRLKLRGRDRLAFRAGQYVQIRVPSEDGAVYRAYSISSPAGEVDEIELIVRLIPGGLGSTYLHRLAVGDPVAFTGPYGEFRLSDDADTEIVCVGGGCGMAPIRSIIHSVCRTWPGRRCRFFFGCRSVEDVFYLQEFQALAAETPNFEVVYALSEPRDEEAWDGETGFVHLAVDKHLQAGPRRQAFLCGPPAMVEAVTAVLEDKQVRPEDIYYDEF